MRIRSIKVTVLAFAAMLALSDKAYAQTVHNYGQEEITFDQDFMTPKVPDKQKKHIREFMRHEATALIKLGYNVATDRGGEVIVVTIPAERLFLPNETELLHSAHEILDNFLIYMRHPGKYKMLLKMHSDNTGSERYNYELTDNRIASLYDFFDAKIPDASFLNGYPSGDTEPLKPNDSRDNRKANRRLEIFIQPGPDMIQNAKNKSKK